MKISTTQFDYNYQFSRKAGNNLHGFYVYHDIDVYNSILIDDIKLNAVYQTGTSYLYNDYECPSPELELSDGGGTSDVLLKINELLESDFDNDEFITETLEEINELCPAIDTVDKLFKVYEFLNDNEPLLAEYLDLDVYTDNFEDYIEDEMTGILTLKNKDS